MDNRISKQGLLDTLSGWNGFLKKKVHLVACGGTAMTLIGVKASTKDVDFIVSVESEYDYLVKTIKDLGYKPASGYGWAKDNGFIFDLFKGKKVFTTELLDSPLGPSRNIKLVEFSHIYVGILNYYDLMISKLFRGTSVDMDDCAALFKSKKGEIDIKEFTKRFKETASYDVAEDKANKNLDYFLKLVK